ncbi:MAG: hypothetical protein DMF84_18255 [Acidobacteria bacterium]|nr:MAG: hypothetical protein DMF84_18255 [Acidobacteriota bacterium]
MTWLSLVLAAAIAQATPAAPPLTRAEMAVFLQKAPIVRSRSISKGITAPVRLTLSDGRVTHDAAFQRVDEQKSVQEFGSGRREYNFVDSWRYNVAAFQIAELIGIGEMMPVTVERKWAGSSGALSWWVDTLMDEAERLKKKREPPDSERWNRQMQTLRVFTELVDDTDRNLGNVLITPEWQICMIDYTRAFRLSSAIRDGEITRCDRKLLEALEALTLASLTSVAQRYLTPYEIKAVLERRDRIVARVRRLIADKGEAAVLY